MRLADADNYYVVRANALEDNVNFYRVVQGRGAKSVASMPRSRPISGIRSASRQRATGSPSALTAATLFTASDRTFAGTGKVALWTKADSVTRFDALTIRPLP